MKATTLSIQWISSILLSLLSGAASAQSAGSVLITGGAAWLKLNSSSDALSSESAVGTFNSDVHVHANNVATAELLLTYFITDHIAVEGVAGVTPKVHLYGQGIAAPIGNLGPSLSVDNFNPLSSASIWSPIVLLKYYFNQPNATFRPYLGLGVNYTWMSSVSLSPAFGTAVQQFGGPGGRAQASLSPSWNPAFGGGFSYQLSSHFYVTASLIYIPLSTNASISSIAANGVTTLVNRTRIKANPLVSFLGVGYRF